MSYQVLARKLRPDTFDALIGQDHVVRALSHALDNDRVHHAFLLTGTRGVGKTTIARILARCLNCEQGVSSTPCGECSNCVDVSAARFVDLIEVDAASRTGIDDVRELLESAAYPPVIGRYKVLLIDEVHQLSPQAFNAMLKTLEEPPEHVKFILATTEAKKVPVTILSRCLQFQLRNISADEVASYLTSVLAAEGIPAEPEALAVLGRAAAGSVRDALSLTDQVIAFGAGEVKEDAVNQMLGLVGRDEVESVLAAVAASDVNAVMAVCAELAERSANFAQILSDLMRALHRAAVGHALNDGSAAAGLSAEQVQLCYQIAVLGARDLPFAPDERSGFEMTLLRMLHFSPTEAGRSVPAAPRGHSDGNQDGPGEPAPEEPEPATAKTTLDSTATPVAPPSSVATSTALAPVRDKPAGQPVRSVATVEDGQGSTEAPPTTALGAPDSGPKELLGEGWYALAAESPLRGVALMILENASVAGHSDEVMLTLESRHETLVSDRHRGQISSWLSERLGRQIAVHIQLGEVACETVAMRRDRLAAERLAAAREALVADSNVKLLIDEFGGELSDVQAFDPAEASPDDDPQTSPRADGGAL